MSENFFLGEVKNDRFFFLELKCNPFFHAWVRWTSEPSGTALTTLYFGTGTDPVGFEIVF